MARQGRRVTRRGERTDSGAEPDSRVIEFHPVDPDSPSYRFVGFVRFFEAAGFREVGRAGSRRHVMRLDLT